MAYNSSYTGAEVDQGIQRASAHSSRHATGGADELVPSDIGAAALVNGKVNPSQASSEIVEVTADKTLALTDAGTCQQRAERSLFHASARSARGGRSGG